MNVERPLEDWEFPEPDDDDDGQPEYRDCPACGAPIHEDAEQCSRCGDYVTFSDPPLAGWPWWFVALGGLGIIAVVWALSRGF